MAEGEGNLGQQHRNISAVDVLETSRQTRIELTNILESILRQLQSENVDENVVDSVQYRLDWIFNTVARYADLQIVELTAVTPDDVVGTF